MTKTETLRNALDMCQSWAAHVAGHGVKGRLPAHRATITALEQLLEGLTDEPTTSEADALDAARYRAFRKSSVRTWNLSFPSRPRTEADIDAEQDRWIAEDAARDPKYANSLFPNAEKARDDYFAAQASPVKSK